MPFVYSKYNGCSSIWLFRWRMLLQNYRNPKHHVNETIFDCFSYNIKTLDWIDEYQCLSLLNLCSIPSFLFNGLREVNYNSTFPTTFLHYEGFGIGTCEHYYFVYHRHHFICIMTLNHTIWTMDVVYTV